MQLPYVEPGTLLFKFLNPNTGHFWSAIADLLGEQKIFLSSRTSFNDPHDSNPEIEDDLSVSLIRNHGREVLANPWRGDRDPAEILQILKLQTQNVRLNKQQIAGIKALARQTAKDFLDECGLASLSLTMDHPLLWGHYAAGYSGICVIFKRGSSLRSGLSLCAKVHYCDALPKLPISLSYRMVAAQRANEEVFRELSDRMIFLSFLNKFKQWEYEQEARIFYPSRASTKIAFEKDELIGIVLGPRSPEFLEERLSAEVSRLAPNVQISRALLSPTDYKISVPDMFDAA